MNRRDGDDASGCASHGRKPQHVRPAGLMQVILERPLRRVLMHGHREAQRTHDPAIEDSLRHDAGLPFKIDPIFMTYSRQNLTRPAPRFTGLSSDAVFRDPVWDAQTHRLDGFPDRTMAGFGRAFRREAGPDRKSQVRITGLKIGDHRRIAGQTGAEAELLRDPIKARNPVTFRRADDAVDPRWQGRRYARPFPLG